MRAPYTTSLTGKFVFLWRRRKSRSEKRDCGFERHKVSSGLLNYGLVSRLGLTRSTLPMEIIIYYGAGNVEKYRAHLVHRPLVEIFSFLEALYIEKFEHEREYTEVKDSDNPPEVEDFTHLKSRRRRLK